MSWAGSPSALATPTGRENIADERCDRINISTTEAPVDRLLDRLDGVRPNGNRRWMARCPAHDDKSPSLSIRETSDGTVLIHDFAGCGAADVLAAVGLELKDLFPDGPKSHHVPARKQHRHSAREVLDAVAHALTVVTLCDAKVTDFLPLDDDEKEAVARAMRVLNKFQREAKR